MYVTMMNSYCSFMNLAVALSMGESMDNLAPRAEEGKPAADEADAPGAPRRGNDAAALS